MDILTRDITSIDKFRLPFLHLDLLVNNAYLAGGACIRLFDPKHSFDDYDIFLLTDEAYPLQKKRLLNNSFQHLKTTYFSESFISKSLNAKVQMVKHVSNLKTIGDVLSKFDIDACRVATDGRNLYYTADAEHAITMKEIGVLNPNNSGLTLKRLQKYQRRGYNITRTAIPSLFEWVRKTPVDVDDYDPNDHTFVEEEDF